MAGPRRSHTRVLVNTRLYQVVHGHAPRGVRSWGFSMGERTGLFWVHDAAYGDAKEQATRRARTLGVTYVTVLP